MERLSAELLWYSLLPYFRNFSLVPRTSEEFVLETSRPRDVRLRTKHCNVVPPSPLPDASKGGHSHRGSNSSSGSGKNAFRRSFLIVCYKTMAAPMIWTSNKDEVVDLYFESAKELIESLVDEPWDVDFECISQRVEKERTGIAHSLCGVLDPVYHEKELLLLSKFL